MNISETQNVGNITVPAINFNKYTNKIIDILKDLKTRFIDKPITKKPQYSSIIDTKSANKEYKKYVYLAEVKSIIKDMDYLAIEMKKDELIEDEFYDFLEIQQITEYLLLKDVHSKISKEELNFITALFKEFKDIIFLKAELFENKTDENILNYDKEYETFQDKFFNYKEKFYVEMYSPSGKHKKTIDHLYALMKE